MDIGYFRIDFEVNHRFRRTREEHKDMMLQMANYWIQTAQKLERADTYRWRRKNRRRRISRVRADDLLLAGRLF